MLEDQYVCRICSNSQNNKVYKVKEMMFGFGDEFIYFECSKCGALQIAEIPKDLRKYYPKNYYSFNQRKRIMLNPLKRFLRNRLVNYLIWKRDIVGKFLSLFFYNSKIASIGIVDGINKTSRILDVGCGNGGLLFILRDIGFKNLWGIDPFIERNIVDNGVTILKRTIHELSETQKFDLIMFHHSFEHLPDQLETLKKAKRLLADNGTILIRMPVKSDKIWKKYGTNWVQIDAPRHVIIHTIRSFRILSKKVGLKINKIIFDSTAFQFWGSELYKRGIPLEIGGRNLKKYFSHKQIKKWEKAAKELNRAQSGDQAIFYLKLE